MCTPWTLSKLLRCKPCFSQHNCPPGDGSETLQSAVVSDAGKRSVIGRKVSTQTEFGKDGVCDHSMLSEDGLTNKNKRYELRLHCGFEDERYIMFCFGEGESDDWIDDNDELKVFDDSGNDAERLNADKQEDGEEESSEGYSQTEWRLKDNSDSGTGSIRSRNSNISGGAAGRVHFLFRCCTSSGSVVLQRCQDPKTFCRGRTEAPTSVFSATIFEVIVRYLAPT